MHLGRRFRIGTNRFFLQATLGHRFCGRPGTVLARKWVRRHAELGTDLLDFNPCGGGSELFRRSRARAMGGSDPVRAVSYLASGSYPPSIDPVACNERRAAPGPGKRGNLAITGIRLRPASSRVVPGE
jgi:hypothetical protein